MRSLLVNGNESLLKQRYIVHLLNGSECLIHQAAITRDEVEVAPRHSFPKFQTAKNERASKK